MDHAWPWRNDNEQDHTWLFCILDDTNLGMNKLYRTKSIVMKEKLNKQYIRSLGCNN